MGNERGGAVKCDCQDWKGNIGKVNAPIILQSVRSGGAYQFDGKAFVFCPWCSKPLTEETSIKHDGAQVKQ